MSDQRKADGDSSRNKREIVELYAQAMSTAVQLSDMRKSYESLQNMWFVRLASGFRNIRRARFRLTMRGLWRAMQQRRFRRLCPPSSREGPASLTLPFEVGKFLDLLSYRPLISIIMPVYETPPPILDETLWSVRNQLYPRWELCVADDRSPSGATRPILERHAAEDPRIKTVFLAENGGISAASNAAATMARGEFLFFMDNDDLLTPDALFQIAVRLEHHPDEDIIYADEDKLSRAGVLEEPCHKPAWCPDNLLSRNYIGHPVALRRSLFDDVGGFRSPFDGSQDYDLLLRATERTSRVGHVPRILYHWRRVEGSVADDPEAKPYAYDAARRALNEALTRRDEPGRVVDGFGLGHYIPHYELRHTGPVSVVIPSRDGFERLEVCLRSIVERSTWQDYEIIVVDHGSTDERFFATIDRWSRADSRIRCLPVDGPFNFSHLINRGAQAATGDYLLLLNDDTEVITPEWLHLMMEQAQRTSIGAVGAKLLYPDGTVQHAGVCVDVVSGPWHLFRGADRADPCYFGQAQSISNYSAVTAACLMIRRDRYDEVQGMDETFAVNFGDVDFCLRLTERGYRHVYLPHVELFHHEHGTRGYPAPGTAERRQLDAELALLRERWENAIPYDPCLTPRIGELQAYFIDSEARRYER